MANDLGGARLGRMRGAVSVAALAAVGGISGCSDAQQGEEVGSVGQPLQDTIVRVQAADVIGTAWIEHFDPGPVADGLCDALGWGFPPFTQAPPVPRPPLPCRGERGVVEGMMVGLSVSANDDPPDSFAGGGWDSWVAGRSYRGFVHIANIDIRCRDGSPIPFTDGAYSHAQPSTNAGYTLGIDGERKAGYSSDLLISPGSDSVTFEEGFSSRLAKLDRLGLWMELGMNAPFIETRVKAVVHCDGLVVIDLARTHAPTHRLYYGTESVGQQNQQDWVRFMTAPGIPPVIPGSLPLDSDGAGVMAGAGPGIHYEAQAEILDESTAITPPGGN